MRNWLLTAGFALLALCAQACGAPRTRGSLPERRVSAPGESALRGPFDVGKRRAAIGRALPEPSDERDDPPIRDVNGVSFYTDDRHSIIDPALEAENREALTPLRDYVKHVTRLADGFVESKPARSAYAVRAVHALGVWARARALLGSVNHQGEYEREWTLGGLALAYLKVQNVAEVDAEEEAEVAEWLCAIAEQVEPYYEHPELTSNRNNHAYWAGLAVAAAGVACDRREPFEWGLARARLGIAQIDARGVLPLELARGRLALHYHRFALSPLVMLAELASANGSALYDENGGALRRLAARVRAGLADPSTFEALSGLPQEQKLPPAGSDLAWAEPYYARFPDAQLAAWLAAARPLRDERLGGNLTIAFGVPLGE